MQSEMMSQDYRLLHPPETEFNQYIHMHDLQPMLTQPQQYTYQMQNHPPGMSNPSATPIYEMTVTSADSACPESTLPADQAMHFIGQRKRKRMSLKCELFPNPDYEMSDAVCSGSENSFATGKRKLSSYSSASAYDDDGYDDMRSSRSTVTSERKQNHSEIEKRRRDKMNKYISELSTMIPMCGILARKLDKLTVLRMAVQHLRAVRGSLSACPFTARPRPAFVTERDLNCLILKAASDSFLIVVSCDRGRLLYVSHSVGTVLYYDHMELLGQSMFDILHPKDVAKVKEQLSSSDLSPRERLIDAKTMLPVRSDVMAGTQRLCPGARRSFLCRIKSRFPPGSETPSTSMDTPVKEEADTKHRKKNEKKYSVVQCTGYLKSWVPADMMSTSGPEGDDEQSTMSCLVAVGRKLPELTAPSAAAETAAPFARLLQYFSRHAIDGKFLFVDQRVTLALGYLPQELLGTSLYEYVSGPDLAAVARAHKHALMQSEPFYTNPYSFLKKDGSVATIQTHFKPFRNPWTKEVECLVAKNSILVDSLASEDARLHYEAFKQTDEWRDYLTGIKGAVKEDSDEMDADVTQSTCQSNHGRPLISEYDADVQQLIDSQVESHKIGSAIAEEALRRPPSGAYASPALLLQDPIFNQTMVDNTLMEADADGTLLSIPAAAASPPLAPMGLDGNGEAAMAVIMSLLEADAGLGGPVNFSGLPWPLP